MTAEKLKLQFREETGHIVIGYFFREYIEWLENKLIDSNQQAQERYDEAMQHFGSFGIKGVYDAFKIAAFELTTKQEQR